MSKTQTHDHEIVSIYPFTDEERDQLLNNSVEAVVMWATKDSWPIGVIHAFVWAKGKIWVTFSEHRHRYSAIKRNPKVSISVSSAGTDLSGPQGAITIKGTPKFYTDDETKKWFYTALSQKLNPNSKDGEEFFYNLLDSPLRTIMEVTPVKFIMYNAGKAGAHMAGAIEEKDLGPRLSGDAERMNKYRKERGLDPR
jgi:general stress protein 26